MQCIFSQFFLKYTNSCQFLSKKVQILTKIFPSMWSPTIDFPSPTMEKINIFGRILREGFKKNLEFSRFGLPHPPILVIAENLEKKNKIFIVLKWVLGNFEQFWKNLFFYPKKCQTTYELDVDRMFLVIWPTKCMVWPTRCVELPT